MIDAEKLFRQLAAKDWDGLSEVLLKNRNLIQKDPYISRVAQLFETEFFDHISSLPAREKLAKMRHISLIIESSRDSFAKAFVDKAIDEKLRALKDAGEKSLANYASTYFDRPLAKKLLQELRLEAPEQLAEARRSSTKIEVASRRKTSAKTIKLFKSSQEENFYNALREVFPQYISYPNVAMSCSIDIEAIRDALTAAEKEYFFKAIVDFVLYDPKEGHEPIYFFELDSKFHDGDRAKRNDALKNAIFRVAGIKLVRIRVLESSEVSVSNLRKMIMDLVGGN